MEIKCKIISSSPEEHSVVVRYYTDKLSEEALAVRNPDTGEIILNSDGAIATCRTDCNVTIWPVPVPTGQDLYNYIAVTAPRQWLELMESVMNPAMDTTLESVSSLIGQEVTLAQKVVNDVPIEVLP